MEKNVWMCMLLDGYSAFLTHKQQEAMRLYYEEDLSLAEISELLGISRQGVRDCLKKAENVLEHTEFVLSAAGLGLKLKSTLERLKLLNIPQVNEIIAQFEEASEDSHGI